MHPDDRILGAAVRRTEDGRFVLGQGTYLDDLLAGDVLHVGFVRSSHAHARIVAVDAERAEKLRGIEAVFTAQTLPLQLRPLPESMMIGQAAAPNSYVRAFRAPAQYPLAVDEVHYVGEPIAVVVGRDRYVVADALEAITVAYEDLLAVVDLEDALAERSAFAHANMASNLAGTVVIAVGDVERGLGIADIVVRERFRMQRVSGLPLEPRGILVRKNPVEGILEVDIASQNPYRIRDGIAQCLGVPVERIRVRAPDVGGGFGSKGMVYPEEIVCCSLALHFKQAIKWVETRVESFLSTNHGREMIVEAVIGARRDGTILGVDLKIFQDCGAYCHYEMVLPTAVINHLPNQYRIANLRAEGHAVLTNKVQVSPYRGAGRPEAIFVIERLIDILSREIGADPADVRRINLIRPDELPYSSGIRMWNGWPVVYDSGNFPAMLDRALELADYAFWRMEQKRVRHTGRLVGVGLAACIEVGGVGPSEGATVTVDETGRVNVFLGVGSQGQSHETVFGQVCAAVLGARLEDVTVRGGDTSLFSYGFGTRASRVAVNAGNAVAKAAEVVRRKAVQIASQLLECSGEDILLESSRAVVQGVPDRGVSLAEIARVAIQAAMPAASPPGLMATEFFYPEAPTLAGSYHVAVVEVDAETGRWEILKYVIVHDCGLPLNVQVVEGQVVGGMAQGLGITIGEELVYDEFGQLLTGSLMDYSIPRADDMPSLSIDHLDFPAKSNPLGVKGIGEGSVAGPAAAIANAIEDATGGGMRITRTPLTGQRVWELLAARRTRA